ncbi:MAG: PAS domain S-box protein, partial [bacterium]
IALSGINENIKKAAAILGFEIKNKKWKQDPDRIKKIGQNAITKFSVLNELTGSVIPDSIVKIIINTFNLGEIFLVKIDKNNKPIGDFTLIFAKGYTLQNRGIVELFANQVGMFIDRKRVQNAQRESEAARKESEERLNRAEKAARIGNWKLMLDTGKMLSSDGAKFIYGVVEDEIPIDIIKNIPLPEYRELLDEALIDLIKNGTPYNINFKICRVDDSRIIDIHSIAEYDKENNIVFGVIRDTTMRNRLMETVRASQEKLTALFSVLPVGISVLDNNSSIIDVNPALEKILDISLEDLKEGKYSNRTYLHSDNTIKPPDEFASSIAIRENRTVTNEVTGIIKENGEVIWTSVNAVPLPDGGAVVVTADITEYKKTVEALLESKEDWKNTFDNLTDMITIHDTDFNIIAANNSAREMLALHPSNALAGIKCFQCYHGMETPPGNCPSCTSMKTLLPCTSEVFEPHLNKYLEIRAIPRINSNQQCIGLIHVVRDITERKSAQEALQQSEARYRSILDASPDDITITDMQGRIVMASPRGVSMFGYDNEAQGYGRSITEFIIPEDRERALANIALKFQGINTGPNEYTGLRADGSTIALESNSEIIYNDDGNPTNIVFVIREITERKRAEAALIESEAKFSLAFKASPEAISIVSLENGRYIDVNDVFLNISGYHKENVIGYTDIDLNFWVDQNEKSHYVEELIQYGFVRYFEAQFRICFGEIRDFLISSEIIELKGERCILNFITDITERKQAEDSLQANEARQAKMVANIGDVIVIINKNGINQYKSPNIERWFGWKPEEVIGHNALDNVHPDDREKAGKFIADLMAVPNANGTTECRYLCKDGSYKWIEFTGFNLMDDPDIKGLLGNYQDITERKRAEEEKSKLEAQLQHSQKMESVGRLAGGVAHDFNNMLQAILGNADMALELTPKDSLIRESLDEICSAAERSADLTRQLLAFARKQTVAPKILNLNETVAGMIKMLQRLIGENIDLAWMPGDNLWQIKVDPSQIDQILANLCVNARDAINGVGKITIETANRNCDEAYCANHIGFIPGNYVQLTISDDGCGIDKEMLEHIFEPFFTTKGVGEGTGLGLATVYGAVKQNNGFIITYSEPGKGTSFNIYLPRHVGKSELLGQDAQNDAVSRGKETILLCEDEPNILKLTTTMLQRLGYNVLAASTPGEAVQLAKDYNGNIQLLMTDVIMPEMNGRDLARNILSIYPNIKRLFMSGYTADVIAHHGVLEDGVNFLQKPFSMKDLSARIRETLEKE